MRYYAPSTGGFYDDAINALIPDDKREISDDVHAALLAQQPAKQIVPGPNGDPIAIDPATRWTLDDIKARKLADLSAACSQRMGAVKAGYPAEEVQSWDKQESEARAYAASGAAASTPLLSALATARGVALADLAARVIVKADAFAALSGTIIGTRQRYEDHVATATDAAGVAAIVWSDA